MSFLDLAYTAYDQPGIAVCPLPNIQCILYADCPHRTPITASKPSGRFMYHQFNIQQTYVLPTLAYLLTPWNRVLLEKITGSAASQEISRFFGTRKFITVLTSARHLSLS